MFLSMLFIFTSDNNKIILNGIPGSWKLPRFQLSVATFFAGEFERKLITSDRIDWPMEADSNFKS